MILLKDMCLNGGSGRVPLSPRGRAAPWERGTRVEVSPTKDFSLIKV